MYKNTGPGTKYNIQSGSHFYSKYAVINQNDFSDSTLFMFLKAFWRKRCVTVTDLMFVHFMRDRSSDGVQVRTIWTSKEQIFTSKSQPRGSKIKSMCLTGHAKPSRIHHKPLKQKVTQNSLKMRFNWSFLFKTTTLQLSFLIPFETIWNSCFYRFVFLISSFRRVVFSPWIVRTYVRRNLTYL